jgi:hypothetical protein
MPVLGIVASGISGNLFTASGAYDSIATVVGNGSSDTVTFSSIPQTYKHLQVRWQAKGQNGATGTNQLIWRANGDGTATNYWDHRLIIGGSSWIAQASNSNQITSGVMNDGTTQWAGGYFDIYDYTSTIKHKAVKSPHGGDTPSGAQGHYTSHLWRNTAAITSLSFTFTSNLLKAGTQFSLYGVK